MSQYPRYITAAPGVTVAWGEQGCSFFLRFATVLDVVPGSTLESAIGTANLSGVIPLVKRSPDGGGEVLSKAALSN